MGCRVQGEREHGCDGKGLPESESSVRVRSGRLSGQLWKAQDAGDDAIGRRGHHRGVVGPAPSVAIAPVVTALRHLLAILLLPFMVVVVIPRWLLTNWAARDTRWPVGTTVAFVGQAAGVLVF